MSDCPQLQANLPAVKVTAVTAEWKSGDIPWLIDAVGDARAVAQMLAELEKSAFAERPAKMRMAGAHGQVSIRQIGGTSARAVAGMEA